MTDIIYGKDSLLSKEGERLNTQVSIRFEKKESGYIFTSIRFADGFPEDMKDIFGILFSPEEAKKIKISETRGNSQAVVNFLKTRFSERLKEYNHKNPGKKMEMSGLDENMGGMFIEFRVKIKPEHKKVGSQSSNVPESWGR